jgi:predicted RNA-binding Zn ribbon-like protein
MRFSQTGQFRARIDSINILIGEPSGFTKLIKTPGSFERRFDVELNEPKQLLVPLAESPADMLCHGDLSRLKRCDNSNCAAFFTTRARTVCGDGVVGLNVEIG